MIGNDADAVLEEYNLLLQVVRDHMMRREQANQPIVLQVQRDGTDDRDQVTFVLGHAESNFPSLGGPRQRPGGNAGMSDASLPFMAELGPLLLQALALQVLFSEQRRRMAAPLDQESVGRLQRMKLKRDIVGRLESEGQSVCSICQDAFLAGCEVYRLPCGHLFDVRCLKQWLERTRTCPNCRLVLEDVDQQYKNVVAPVWWRNVCESEEEQKGKELGFERSVERRASLESRRVSAMRARAANDREIHIHRLQPPREIVLEAQEEQERQRQPRELLRLPPTRMSPPMTLSSISVDSTSAREVFLDDNGGYSFFSARNLMESNGINFEPVPPSYGGSRRPAETFRGRLFAGETIAPSPPPPPSSSLLAPSRLSEPRVSEPRGRNVPALRCFSGQEEQRSPARTLMEVSLPSSDGAWPEAVGGTRRRRSPVAQSSPRSQQASDGDGEYNISMFIPHGPRDSPVGSPTSRGEPFARSVTPVPQTPPPREVAPAVGGARHVVQALRRQRVEEDRHSHPTNNNNNNNNDNSSSSNSSSRIGVPYETIAESVSRQRHAAKRVNVRSLPAPQPLTPVPAPAPPQSPSVVLAPPQPSLAGISGERGRHVSTSGSNIAGVQNVAQPPAESRPQPVRGNRRNLAQYEAIIRGQRRRRS